MKLKLEPFSLLVVLSMLSAPLLRAQENPSDDSDLAKMMKEAEDLQKKNPPASKKKMEEMQADAQEEVVRMEAQEKKEKEALQAALKKQLAEPGNDTLPVWTPKTPNFTAAGPAVKKIVDEEVKIIQTGTSTLTPKELADRWEAAAEATGRLNHVRNNITSNGNLTTIMFLSTRTSPEEKVEMEARRAPEEKVTTVEISSPLPKPEIPSEE